MKPVAAALSPKDARRPVVIFANGLGDHLLALPALRAIGAALDGRLRLVCGRGLRKVFFSDVPLAACIETTFTPNFVKQGYEFDAAGVSGAIRPCDLLIVLHGWWSSAIGQLVECLQPDLTIGFGPDSQLRPVIDGTMHAFDLAFTAATLVAGDASFDSYSQRPAISEELDSRVRRLRAVLGNRRLLVVHADTKPDKMWGVTPWRALIRQLQHQMPDLVVAVVGQRQLGLHLDADPDQTLNLVGLPLEDVFAIISGCDYFVGVDSCMLHCADLCRIPGVGLFGPTSPEEWGFRFSVHRHVRAPANDLERLDVDAVLHATTQLIADNPLSPQRFVVDEGDLCSGYAR